MVLTFGEAYKIVCPEGNPVDPQSQQYKDIMELMRQSGYLQLQDRLVKENIPLQATRIDQVRQFTERQAIALESTKVSKKQWLSVKAHRDAFLAHLNKK